MGGFRPYLAMDTFCEVRGQSLASKRHSGQQSPVSCRDSEPFAAVFVSELHFSGFRDGLGCRICFCCHLFDQFLISDFINHGFGR